MMLLISYQGDRYEKETHRIFQLARARYAHARPTRGLLFVLFDLAHNNAFKSFNVFNSVEVVCSCRRIDFYSTEVENFTEKFTFRRSVLNFIKRRVKRFCIEYANFAYNALIGYGKLGFVKPNSCRYCLNRGD